MRPSVGGNALQSRAQKQNHSDFESANTAPTTFFMASESMLDANSTPVASMSDSTFGVRSFEEDADTADAENETEGRASTNNLAGSRRRSTIKPQSFARRDDSMDSLGLASSISSPGSSPSRPQRKRQYNTDSASQPLTPISYTSPMLGTSAPSSPKSSSARSFRQSDDESLGGSSQAVVSSDEESDGLKAAVDESIAPQLVMPSIAMPSRRPFTEQGKSLGRLKILLAGSSGVGKTSLMKSIVQICEDIVHVDPLPSAGPTLKRRNRSKSHNSTIHPLPTKHMTEIYASTKAYPRWWSELEESNVLRKRRSSEETVLERNLCFVDSPGFDSGTSVLEGMENVLQYIEDQIHKSSALENMSDAELLSILGGGGGNQVDVVLYMSTHALKPADIEFLRQLSQLTNVIPLLSKVDTLTHEDTEHLKSSISATLQTAGIKTFSLSLPQTAISPPYTVCSTSSTAADLDTMDASLLMHSDYSPPLHPSELPQLLAHLLTKDTLSHLKHSSAKKSLRTRSRSPPLPTSSSSLLTSSSLTLLPRPHAQRSNTNPLTYAQARITDHTLREERLAQIHLANWAGNLQRSLQRERARYEELARDQRREWLRARLGECVFDGELAVATGAQEREKTSHSSVDGVLVPLSGGRGAGAEKRGLKREKYGSSGIAPAPTSSTGRRGSLLDLSDPLGLMRWADTAGKRSWVVLRVLGGCGVLGAVAFWAFRNWGWAWDWSLGFDEGSERVLGGFGWWESGE